MPFTLLGWLKDVDEAGAWTQLDALADESVSVNSPAISVPTLNKLVLAAAGVSSATVINGGRLDAPSIRDICRPYIVPVNLIAAADVTPNDPFRFLDRRQNPLTLTPGEGLTAFVIGDPAATHKQWVLAWLADNPITPLPAGAEVQSLRWTAAKALTAFAWTNGAIVFDEALPVGTYQVVGFRAESAGLIAARLLFKGTGWRPGVLGNKTPQEYGHPTFRAGNMGVFGEFDLNNPPTVDFLSITADAAEYGVIDLVKTA